MEIRKYLLASFVVLLLSLFAQAQHHKNLANQNHVFEGVIRTFVFEDEKVSMRHYLDTGNERLLLARAGENFVNQKVSITGKLNAENIIIPEKIEISASSKVSSSIPVSGSRKVLVLLLNYQNDTTQPVSVAQVKSKIFTDATSPNQYFQQVSGNRMRLSGRQSPEGDVFGYFTLPFNNDYCDASRIIIECSKAADNLALNSGIDVNLYQSVIYLFSGNNPNGNLIFADLGVLGDQTTTQRVYFMNPFSDFNSSVFQFYVAHEIGHNLGLNHVSGFRNCPTTLPIEACADFIDNADRSDVMGYFGYHLLSNYHRLRLGWLGGKIRIYQSPGTYYVNLHSPSHPSKAATMVQIRTKDSEGNFTGKSFFLEYRRNQPPFDIFRSGEFPLPPVQLADKGVSVRFGNEDLFQRIARFYIVDTTPETFDFGDAALTPGNIYINSYYGIKITATSVNPFFGARVKIELNR